MPVTNAELEKQVRELTASLARLEQKLKGEPELSQRSFEIAQKIRREGFDYLVKGGIYVGIALLSALVPIIWAYIEWRLPKIAGGVSKGAIVAFMECPEEGWKAYDRARSR